MPLLVVPVLVVLAMIVLIPLSLVQRYRMGTSRQRARAWLAALNAGAMALSAALVLGSAAVTSLWVPGALTYTAAGLVTGCVLGIAGLRLTRWETAVPGTLHYTPNRWLVLAITLAVTGRLFYGFWRGWHTWRAGSADGSWLAAAGVAGSMAFGAVVLGYYLAYWIGVRRRIRRHAAARLR